MSTVSSTAHRPQGTANLSIVDVTAYGEEDDEAQRLINEEYKTWKKNAPFLYDMILRYGAIVDRLELETTDHREALL